MKHADDFPYLTPAQCDLLLDIAKGGTIERIAKRCGKTHGTVRSHLQAMYRTFGVSDRFELFERVSHYIGETDARYRAQRFVDITNARRTRKA